LKEYEAKDKRIEVYGQGENHGIVENFEFLIGKVRAEYFMFADQDDIWNPDKIEKSLKKMEDEKLDLVYTDLEVVDSRLNVKASSYWKAKGLDYRIYKYNNFESLYLNNFVTGCTMLVKSKWINEFLPLPRESKYVLHDYWIALIVSQSGKIGYLNEPTIKYRQHSNNKIGAKTESEKLDSIEDVRNLFIKVKLEHFSLYVKHNDYFKNDYIKQLNKDALEYYEGLKNVKNFTFKNLGMFFKLYKYESFNYKMKNLAILHFPALANIPFKEMKKKQRKEEEILKAKQLELEKAKQARREARQIKKAELEAELEAQAKNKKGKKGSKINGKKD
jgi:hypothetical protein